MVDYFKLFSSILDMKIMLCILTSSCIPRLIRLVNNVNEIYPVEGVELVPIVVVNTTKDSYFQDILKLQLPVPVIRTDSNGKPGKGKNSCLDLFLASSCDFVSQIDGDDILYPTYLQSIVEHITRFPCIDVLGIVPMDVIDNNSNVKGYSFKVGENTYAGVWGVSLVPTRADSYGPGISTMFSQDLPNSADFIILQSKKSAKIKMDEDIEVGEDHLYSFQLLAEHQKGNLTYFHTMSSDMFIIDRTTEVSVQKLYPQIRSVAALKEKALKYVKMERSNIWELPVIYKELLLNQFEKESWLVRFLKNI
jgi:hypothetical protein